MAKEIVFENGEQKEVDSVVFARPNKTQKQKDKWDFSRKDKILIKWLANKFGMTFQQAKNEIKNVDDTEPDEEIIG